MTLREWLDAQGPGAKSALSYATGLSWATIDRACDGRARLESASIIHRLTKRAVPVEAMTPPRRKRAANPEKLKRLAS